jgi:chemotaxis protein CheD
MSKFYDQPREPNFYYDNRFKIDTVKILPGEYYATARPMLIVTVLGSCVAACIRDKISNIGGMNHFMLPFPNDFGDAVSNMAIYGDYAMAVLINQMLEMGAQRHNLEAKIFGGGNLLKGVTTDRVGERNAAFVRHYLNKQKIPILAEDLLGDYPRKIYFFPEQGAVKVKKLIRLHNDTIIQREQEHRQRMWEEEKARATVDLFY